LEKQRKHQEQRFITPYRMDFLNHTRMQKIYLSQKKKQETTFQERQTKKIKN